MARAKKKREGRLSVRVSPERLERWHAAADANHGEDLSDLVRRAVDLEVERIEALMREPPQRRR